MVTALWPYIPATTMRTTPVSGQRTCTLWNSSPGPHHSSLSCLNKVYLSIYLPPSHTATTALWLEQSNFKWCCWLIYLISMNKSCFPSGHYLSIDKASDLTGMKSVVGVNYCDHVPLQKHYRINTLPTIWWEYTIYTTIQSYWHHPIKKTPPQADILY